MADAVVTIHFLWILFIIYGFIMTIYTFFFAKNKRFLDRWFLRSIHLLSIIFTSILELTGKYCPITVLENYLRPASAQYQGTYIGHYLEKLVYPDINPAVLITVAVVIAVFTLVIFIIRPPEKIKKMVLRIAGLL